MKVGLIRVVTQTEAASLHCHGALIERTFPSLSVLSCCIDNQPEGVYDEESERQAVPKVVKLGQRLFEEEGVQALIVSCAADPGVELLRRRLPIPVIGAGESIALLARSLGHAVGVLTITGEVPRSVRQGLGDRYQAMAQVEGTKTTRDLKAPDVLERALEAGARLKEAGCDTIALACTGFSTIQLAPQLQRELGLPVIDPVLACGAVVCALALPTARGMSR